MRLRKIAWELLGLGVMVVTFFSLAIGMVLLLSYYPSPSDSIVGDAVGIVSAVVAVVVSYYLGQRVIGDRGIIPAVFVLGRE